MSEKPQRSVLTSILFIMGDIATFGVLVGFTYQVWIHEKLTSYRIIESSWLAGLAVMMLVLAIKDTWRLD